MRLDEILKERFVDEDIYNYACAQMLTGSYQYGTYNQGESDLDLVIIHTRNIDNLFKMESDGNRFNAQFETTVDFNGIETKVDIRVISLDTFAKKLYKGDMNCIEYINSPFINWVRGSISSGFGDESQEKTHEYSFMNYKHIFLNSLSPAIKYKLLKSCLGFINNLKESGSTKRKRIPEQINPNNIVRIANLYYLIRNHFYPLNPNQALELMNVEVIDTSSPNFNNLDNMTAKMEQTKGELESQYDEAELNTTFWNKYQYDTLTRSFYLNSMQRAFVTEP